MQENNVCHPVFKFYSLKELFYINNYNGEADGT